MAEPYDFGNDDFGMSAVPKSRGRLGRDPWQSPEWAPSVPGLDTAMPGASDPSQEKYEWEPPKFPGGPGGPGQTPPTIPTVPGQGPSPPRQTPPTIPTDQPRGPFGKPGGRKPGPTGDRSETYKRALSSIEQSTDPKARAVAQDQLARQLYRDFEQAGHDVKWDGTTLVVDGRRYQVAGSNHPLQGGGGMIQQASVTGGSSQGPPAGGGGQMPQQGGPAQIPNGGGGGVWPGPQQGSPTPTPNQTVPGGGPQQTGQGPQNPPLGSLTPSAPVPVTGGPDVAAGQREYVDYRNPPEGVNFDTLNLGDAVANRPGWVWGYDVGGGGWFMTPQGSGIGQPFGGQPGEPGYPGGGEQGGGPGGGGPGGGFPASQTGLQFQPTAQPYTPGEIGTDDLQGFSYDSLLEDMGEYAPGDPREGLPEVDWSELEGLTNEQLRYIAQHPESMSPEVVAMLQGRAADQFAGARRAGMEEMQGAAYAGGYADSPWLAAAGAQADWANREGLINAQRDIAIEAARTNTADRRAAASLLGGATDAEAAREMGYRQQRFGENQQQEDNLFRSANLRTQQVMGAVDADLRRAAETTNRLALREQVEQAAARLGMDADALQLQWLESLIDETTARYGIDIGAQIDREKLAQAGSEFQSDLAFRILALQSDLGYRYAALDQNASQFGQTFGENQRQFNYGYGVDVANLNRQSQNDAFNRFSWLFE